MGTITLAEVMAMVAAKLDAESAAERDEVTLESITRKTREGVRWEGFGAVRTRKDQRFGQSVTEIIVNNRLVAWAILPKGHHAVRLDWQLDPTNQDILLISAWLSRQLNGHMLSKESTDPVTWEPSQDTVIALNRISG